MSYEKEWATENKKKNQGSMNILMDMDGNANYETPRPNSRIGCNAEAKDIGMKNRGGTGCIFGIAPSCSTSQPNSRVKGYEAEEIHNKGRNGTISGVLNTQVNSGYTTSRGVPRVKPEAEDIALRNSNGSMGLILNSNKNTTYRTARGASRGVKPEAEDNAVKGKGTMNVILDNQANNKYYTPRGKQRVKPEAEGIAVMNKGTMNLVLSSDNKPNDQPKQRVKPEASDIYQKNKGTLSQIYSSYGTMPLSARPAPKVKGQGEEIENHGRKGTLCFLLTKYGNLPRDSKPQARVKSEAQRFAKQGQGSIGDLLGTQGKKPRRYSSGR